MSEEASQFNRVSLYEQIAQRLLSRIRKEYQPGDRLPSEAALSKELGVSAITLREALSVLAYRGVIERRHGSGTYVLDPTASQWIAIVTNLDLSHPNLSYFHRRVAYHLRSLLSDGGFKVRIYSGAAAGSPSLTQGSDLPAAILDDLKLAVVRAIIYLPSSGWEIFRDAGIPLVGTDPGIPLSVTLPTDDFLHSAMRSLSEQGCKKVALLGWEHSFSTKEWMESLSRHGLSSEAKWFRSDLDYSSSDAGWSAFHELWRSHKAKPDGLIINDDILFREVSLAILSERIQVPRDLKVFTHYNQGSRIILPFPCTIFDVDPDMHARELAGLCKLAVGPKPPKSKHVRLTVQVIEHGPNDPPALE